MFISDLPKVMIISFFITIIIELGIAFFLKYRKRDLLNIFLVNLLTNPLLNSVVVTINFYYGLRCRNIALLFLEIIVFLIEGVIYQKYLNNRKLNGYLLSLLLNISSFGLGLIINKIIY